VWHIGGMGWHGMLLVLGQYAGERQGRRWAGCEKGRLGRACGAACPAGVRRRQRTRAQRRLGGAALQARLPACPVTCHEATSMLRSHGPQWHTSSEVIAWRWQ